MRLDWLGRLRFVPCRDNGWLAKYNIDPERALRRMVSVDLRQVVHEGIDTFLQMSVRIPLLWPICPILWIARRIGVGRFLYDWLAKKRKIVPIGQCELEGCQIPQ